MRKCCLFLFASIPAAAFMPHYGFLQSVRLNKDDLYATTERGFLLKNNVVLGTTSTLRRKVLFYEKDTLVYTDGEYHYIEVGGMTRTTASPVIFTTVEENMTVSLLLNNTVWMMSSPDDMASCVLEGSPCVSCAGIFRNWILIGSVLGQLEVMCMASGKSYAKIKISSDAPVTAMSCHDSPSGYIMACACLDGYIRILELSDSFSLSSERRIPVPHWNRITDVVMRRKCLVSREISGLVRFMNPAGKVIKTDDAHLFHSYGDTVVIGSKKGMTPPPAKAGGFWFGFRSLKKVDVPGWSINTPIPGSLTPGLSITRSDVDLPEERYRPSGNVESCVHVCMIMVTTYIALKHLFVSLTDVDAP